MMWVILTYLTLLEMSQENNYDYDSPDLWARIKGTRDSVSSASISNKYRSPGYRPSPRRCAENNNTASPQRNLVSPSQVNKMQATVVRATNISTVTCKPHKAIATAIPKCFKAPEPVVATSRLPSNESKPPSHPSSSSKPLSPWLLVNHFVNCMYHGVKLTASGIASPYPSAGLFSKWITSSLVS